MRGRRREPNEKNMKKQLTDKSLDDELRPEYNLSQMKGVRGKYYRRALGGMNLVLIEPDLAKVFPDSTAVNRALRTIAEAAQNLPSKSKRSRAS